MKPIRAFTLIEITVVVAIIIILSSIFLANYREGERQFALQRSVHKLAQDLRRAQEMALAGKEFDGTFPKGGYGIYFKKNSNSYILFADCDNGLDYDEWGNKSCLSADDGEGNSRDEKIEELFLEENIKIADFSPVSPEGALIIAFFPPDPVVKIFPRASSASIKLSFNGHPLTVSINSAGLIDIQ